jgi:hypothetical protein
VVFWPWFLGVWLLFWATEPSENDFFNSLPPSRQLVYKTLRLEKSRSSDHRDDDFALGPAAFDMSEGLRGLVERVRLGDDGTEDS